MSEQALPMLKYICLESGLLQSKAISVDKASLARIYKTPSAFPLPFPHPPWGGATTNVFLYPPMTHTCPGRKFIPLSSSATWMASSGSCAPHDSQPPLLTCEVNKYFTMNTPITEAHNHCIWEASQGTMYRLPYINSVFPICTYDISEPVWMYRHRCSGCKHPRRLCMPQFLSKPVPTLITIASNDIKLKISNVFTCFSICA